MNRSTEVFRVVYQEPNSTEVFRVVYQEPNGQWLTAYYADRFGATKRLDAFRAAGRAARLERWYRDADGTFSQAPPNGRRHEAAHALYVAAHAAANAILDEFGTSRAFASTEALAALAVLRDAVEDYSRVTRAS